MGTCILHYDTDCQTVTGKNRRRFKGEIAKTPIIFAICKNTQKTLISQKRFLQSSFFLFHLAITPINFVAKLQ